MKTKTMALNILGISIILIILACTISGAPVNAQAGNVNPNGNVRMWTSQTYYHYGEEVDIIIQNNARLYGNVMTTARLLVINPDGSGYELDMDRLWQGTWEITVGQAGPPSGHTSFILYEGSKRLAITSCYIGP